MGNAMLWRHTYSQCSTMQKRVDISDRKKGMRDGEQEAVCPRRLCMYSAWGVPGSTLPPGCVHGLPGRLMLHAGGRSAHPPSACPPVPHAEALTSSA